MPSFFCNATVFFLNISSISSILFRSSVNKSALLSWECKFSILTETGGGAILSPTKWLSECCWCSGVKMSWTVKSGDSRGPSHIAELLEFLFFSHFLFAEFFPEGGRTTSYLSGLSPGWVTNATKSKTKLQNQSNRLSLDVNSVAVNYCKKNNFKHSLEEKIFYFLSV